MEEGFNTKFTKLSLKQKELMNTQVAICKENKMLDQRGEKFYWFSVYKRNPDLNITFNFFVCIFRIVKRKLFKIDGNW